MLLSTYNNLQRYYPSWKFLKLMWHSAYDIFQGFKLFQKYLRLCIWYPSMIQSLLKFIVDDVMLHIISFDNPISSESHWSECNDLHTISFNAFISVETFWSFCNALHISYPLILLTILKVTEAYVMVYIWYFLMILSLLTNFKAYVMLYV